MKKIVVTLISFMMLIMFFFLLTISMGNPIQKIKFEKEVREYLNTTYPNFEFGKVTIKYDFKNMTFYAIVKSTYSHDVEFTVKKKYNGQLFDNYISASWAAEIRNECQRMVSHFFDTRLNVYVTIYVDGKRYLAKPDAPIEKIPSYDEVREKIASDTTIYFTGDFTETHMQSILGMIKWLADNRYMANVFFSSEQLIIRIPHEHLKSVQEMDDLSKFISKLTNTK